MSLLNVIFRKCLYDYKKLACLSVQVRSHCILVDSLQKSCGNERQNEGLLLKYDSNLVVTKRFKKLSKAQKIYEEIDKMQEEESDTEDDEDEDDSGLKKYTYKVNSLRLDTVTKTAAGMSRQNVEKSFYKGKLYVNGEHVNKKGNDVKIGDVIDLIKGPSKIENKVQMIRINLLDFKLDKGGYVLILTKETIDTNEYSIKEEEE